MPKKQVESTIFEEQWFMDLEKHYKMLMLYFFITSDHAGLGRLNFKIINIYLDYNYDKGEALEVLSEHISEYKEGKYQLVKYMKYHYTEGNNSQVYRSAKKKLKNEGLLNFDNDEDEKYYNDAVDKGLVSGKFLKKIGKG